MHTKTISTRKLNLKLLISFFLISAPGLWAQSAVFQPSALEKISLSSASKPVERDLRLVKWFPAKIGKDKAWADFEKTLQEDLVYLPEPLREWVSKRFFTGTGNNPKSETWLLRDGTSYFIRHFDVDKNDLDVEIYDLESCRAQSSCAKAGLTRFLSYEARTQITKYQLSDSASYSKFLAELKGRQIVLRNYLLQEIKEKFFDASQLAKIYPQAEFVTWTLITGDKLIIRRARIDGQDVDFQAISIPYVPYTSGTWSLTLNFDMIGFDTTNEEVSSYLDIGGGYALTRRFINGWGRLDFTNTGQFQLHFDSNDELEVSDYEKYIDTILIEQELGERYELLTALDAYRDTSIGILFGARALPGFGVNLLGFENRYRFDPVVSYSAGYRYELSEIIGTTKDITYEDILFAYRFKIGNKDYGGAATYWFLQVEYQHPVYSINSESDEEEVFPGEVYRITYIAQLGWPIFSGKWNLYLTYLREEINDQLGQVTNNSGMLSFEATVF